jgi:hypothetical protein
MRVQGDLPVKARDRYRRMNEDSRVLAGRDGVVTEQDGRQS